jgi:hypothetical protein
MLEFSGGKSPLTTVETKMELVKTMAMRPALKPTTNRRLAVNLKRAVRVARRTYGTEHVEVAMALIQLGDYLSADERFDESARAFRQAASIYESLGVGHELLLALALRSLAHCSYAMDNYADGSRTNEQAMQLIRDYQ